MSEDEEEEDEEEVVVVGDDMMTSSASKDLRAELRVRQAHTGDNAAATGREGDRRWRKG